MISILVSLKLFIKAYISFIKIKNPHPPISSYILNDKSLN